MWSPATGCGRWRTTQLAQLRRQLRQPAEVQRELLELLQLRDARGQVRQRAAPQRQLPQPRELPESSPVSRFIKSRRVSDALFNIKRV